MKSFYNQKTRKIEEIENYKKHSFDLDVSMTYGLNYYKQLDDAMGAFFAAIEPTEEPILFTIIGDFESLKYLKIEELTYYLLSVTNIFASHLFTKERTDTEFRLTAPKFLDTVKLNGMVRKDLVNKKLKYPIFSMSVENIDGTEVYRVI